MVSELAQKVINKKPYLEIRIVTYTDDGMMYYTNEPLQSSKGYEFKENLDRIKLPCYCTFEWRGKRRLGILRNNRDRKDTTKSVGINMYSLNEIDKQTNKIIGDLITTSCSLKPLIDFYKINIGKVKLTYYETI